MKPNKSLGKALFLSMASFFSTLFLLGACTPAPQNMDVYHGASGSRVILGDKDICRASCNDSYDRCLDTGAAQYNRAHDDTVSSVLGAKGDCKADLTSCLSSCP